MIGASVRKYTEVALRLDDHKVHIERFECGPADGLQHHRPDGDVRYETAIHYIDMHPIRAGRINRTNFLAQTGEIRREHRWRNENPRHGLAHLNERSAWQLRASIIHGTGDQLICDCVTDQGFCRAPLVSAALSPA